MNEDDRCREVKSASAGVMRSYGEGAKAEEEEEEEEGRVWRGVVRGR